MHSDAIFSDIRGVTVPEQYLGLRFNTAQVPTDLGPMYASTLDQLHTAITTLSLRNHNIALCAPSQHSKSVWVYSCIQNLFRQRAPVKPFIDILEFARMIGTFCEEDDWYEVPYLFLRVPTEVTTQARSTIVTVLDRRVRRGNSTIFIYDGSWAMMTYNDNLNVIKSLQGDGSFHSLDVKSFRVKEEK